MTCDYCQQDPCKYGDIEFCMDELTVALPPSPLCNRCGHPLCASCSSPRCDLSCDENGAPDGACSCDGCDVERADFDRWQVEMDRQNEWLAHVPGVVHLVELAAGPWFPEQDRLDRTRRDRERLLLGMLDDLTKMGVLGQSMTTTLQQLMPGAIVGSFPEQPIDWIDNMAIKLAALAATVSAKLDELRPFVSREQTDALAESLRKDSAARQPRPN